MTHSLTDPARTRESRVDGSKQSTTSMMSLVDYLVLPPPMPSAPWPTASVAAV